LKAPDARTESRKARVIRGEGERAHPSVLLKDVDQHGVASAKLLPFDFDAPIGRGRPRYDTPWYDRKAYLACRDDVAVFAERLDFDATLTARNDERNPGKAVRGADGARLDTNARNRAYPHRGRAVAYPDREPTT
jgi:hypothetical protein